MTYEERLSQTADVFKALVEHAKDGGSYRCLIYDRLGFGVDSYVTLFEAGGMTISNEFNLYSDRSIASKQTMIDELIEYVETNLNLKAPNQFRSALLELGWEFNELLEFDKIGKDIINQYKDELENQKELIKQLQDEIMVLKGGEHQQQNST